jgi:hypothetical protein
MQDIWPSFTAMPHEPLDSIAATFAVTNQDNFACRCQHVGNVIEVGPFAHLARVTVSSLSRPNMSMSVLRFVAHDRHCRVATDIVYQPDANIVVRYCCNDGAFSYVFNCRRINHARKVSTRMYRSRHHASAGTYVVSFTQTIASQYHSTYRRIQRDKQRLHHRKDVT